MEAEYNCPLVGTVIDETICYDIQMVTGGMINKRILRDYEDDIDIAKVTVARASGRCPVCPFNQLLQPAPRKTMAL
jgi:hypothetical protein